jgi:hypothetical protein
MEICMRSPAEFIERRAVNDPGNSQLNVPGRAKGVLCREKTIFQRETVANTGNRTGTRIGEPKAITTRNDEIGASGNRPIDPTRDMETTLANTPRRRIEGVVRTGGGGAITIGSGKGAKDVNKVANNLGILATANQGITRVIMAVVMGEAIFLSVEENRIIGPEVTKT